MLLFYEIKKTITSKVFCLILSAIMLCNVFFAFYSGLKKSDGIPEEYFIDVMKMYNENPDFVEDEAERLRESLLKQAEYYTYCTENGLPTIPFVHEFNYIDDGKHTDFDLLQAFIDNRNAAIDYPNIVSAHIKQAELNKQRNLFLSSAQDIQSTVYQDKIIEQYTCILNNNNVSFDYVYGWDRLLDYNGNIVFSLCCAVIISVWIFIFDKTNKSVTLIKSTKNGRRKNTAIKMLAAILLSLTAVFCIYLITFVIHATTIGFSDYRFHIQLLPNYALCPWILNFLQVYFLNFCITSLAIIPIIMISILISELTRSYFLSILGSSIVIGLNLFFYNSHTASTVLKLNLFYLTSPKDFFSKYQVAFLGNRIWELYVFAVVVYLIVSALSAFCIIFFESEFSKNYLNTKKSLFKIYFPQSRISKKYSEKKSLKTSNLFMWECYKKRILLLVSGVCILVYIIGISVSVPTLPASDHLYREYAKILHGKITEEKLQYINSEAIFINDKISCYEKMFVDYQSGNISFDEYSLYLADYKYSVARHDVIEYVKNYAEYLVECNKDGIEAVFIYDTGIKKIIDPNINILLVILIILFCGNTYPMEYMRSSSASPICDVICTTKFGRKKTFTTKTVVCIVISTVLFVIIKIADIMNICLSYSMDSPFVSIASIKEYSQLGNITIITYLVLTYLFSYLFIIMLSIFTSALSQIIKNPLGVYSAVIGFAMLPYVFNLLGFKGAKYIDYLSLSNGNNLFDLSYDLVPENPLLIVILYAANLMLIATFLHILSFNNYVRRR